MTPLQPWELVHFRRPNASQEDRTYLNWLGKDVVLIGSDLGGYRNCGERDIINFKGLGRDYSVIEFVESLEHYDLAGRRPMTYFIDLSNPANVMPIQLEIVISVGGGPAERYVVNLENPEHRIIALQQGADWVKPLAVSFRERMEG